MKLEGAKRLSKPDGKSSHYLVFYSSHYIALTLIQVSLAFLYTLQLVYCSFI